MTIKTNYFDGQSYAAVDDVAPWASLLTDGVFNVAGGALAVSQYTTPNLSVNVAAGNLIKNGYFVKSDATVNLSIAANSSGYNRIDLVVANIDTTNKVATLQVVQGTPSSSPTAPLPTANQLAIAQVFVGNNVSAINNANITDVRTNVDVLNGAFAAIGMNTSEYSLGATGYIPIKIKDKLTGQIRTLIFQWGTGTTGTETSTSGLYSAFGTVTFPIAFSNACLKVWHNPNSHNLAFPTYAAAISLTQANCYLVTTASGQVGSTTFMWFAIGY